MKDTILSPTQPARYRLRLQGCMSVDWSDWLLDYTVGYEEDQMIVTGVVRDQSALFGLLNFMRDLGMPLLLVEYLPNLENKG